MVHAVPGVDARARAVSGRRPARAHARPASDPRAAPAPSIRVLRELEEVRALRSGWARQQWHPLGDVDHLLERVARQPDFVRPCVVVAEAGGGVVGILGAAFFDEEIAWRVGGHPVLHSRARVLRLAAPCLMGRWPPALLEAAFGVLRNALGEGEADALYLHQIERASPLARAALDDPGPGRRDPFPRSTRSWHLDLPESLDAFLASRGRVLRKGLRRYTRRIEQSLPDLRLVRCDAPHELDRILRDSAAVARRTYHANLGVAFVDDEATRDFVAWALCAGWFRAHFLYAGARPIAFSHALHYGRTLFLRDTGFDPDFAEYRAGTYLLLRMIEEHCALGTRTFDYGVFEAEYKRQLGTRSSDVVSAYVFARTAAGRALFAKRLLTGAADRTARAVLGPRARQLSRRIGGVGR